MFTSYFIQKPKEKKQTIQIFCIVTFLCKLFSFPLKFPFDLGITAVLINFSQYRNELWGEDVK